MGRRKTRELFVGKVGIGGANPIRVQSMCSVKTWDVEAAVAQIKALKEAGCEIVRVAIPDRRSVAALPEIRKRIGMPLVADLHYDPQLALEAIPNVQSSSKSQLGLE